MKSADLLNKQFSNVYTKEDIGHSPKPTIGSLIVTLPGVFKQLTSLKPNKASGPDQIPPWFLKLVCPRGPILIAIIKLLLLLVLYHPGGNMLMYAGLLRVVSGQTLVITGYISLTCIASKVLENIVHSHLTKHLDSHRILTDVQHGFRAKQPSFTYLITTIHDLANTIEDNKSVHTAILDFSKAFDKLRH